MAHCNNKLPALHPVPPAALVTVAVVVVVVVELVVALECDIVLLLVNCCFPPSPPPRSAGSADGSSAMVIRLLGTTPAVAVVTVELLPVVAGCTGAPSANGAIAVDDDGGLSDVAVAPASGAEAGTRCCGLL